MAERPVRPYTEIPALWEGVLEESFVLESAASSGQLRFVVEPDRPGAA
jgi:hypothetical protein